MRLPTTILLGAALLLLSIPAQGVQLAGVDGMMQTVKAKGHSGMSGLAVRTRLISDDLPLDVSLMPSIEYWRNADRISDFGIYSAQSDFTLNADARYDFTGHAVQPYLGAGLGVHFIKQKFESSSPPVNRNQDHTRFGPSVFVGIQLVPVGWLQSFVDARYAFVTDYGQFKLNWGFGVNF